ncbi:MAG: NTP transferase domain-containing protein [Deltaproteobacteria bacterium]|nr:NTP transferase domain-containing protein [Deltaproteobacteria bacterium]
MNDISETDAVILAGGLGTRLQKVVSDRPKVLAQVAGRPFLTYLLSQLEGTGFRRVVLCTGHLGDQVESAFGDEYGSLCLEYSRESRPLGTGGALRLALPLINSQTILVANGDSYCGAKLGALFEFHKRRGAQSTILLTDVDDVSRYGCVRTDAGGAVLGFDEKNSEGGPGWINAGVYVIERNLLAKIPPDESISLERDLFPSWIGRGFHGFEGPGRFLDIGTEESFAAAQSFFK